MTNKMIIGFSIIVICIFSLGFVYFGANVLSCKRSGSENAEAEFKNFIETMQENAENEYLTEKYLTNLQNKIEKNEYIAAVTIKDEQKTFFAYPLSSKYISISSVSPEIKVSSAMLTVCSQTIHLDSTETFVNAAVYLVSPSKIFDLALNSFYIILAGTLLAVIFLILYISTTKEEPNNQKAQSKKVQEYRPTTKKAKNYEPIIGTIPSPVLDEVIEMPSVENYGKEEQSEQKNIKQEEHAPQNSAKRTIDPLGLFSPSTGLSWESYLEPRLDAELVRAASSEQDLSLIYIRSIDLVHNHPCSKQIANLLLEYFNFRDLLFEFGKDGYICILQDRDLLKSLGICEKLYKDLTSILGQFGLSTQLVIGISARSLRLTNGIRLVKEAMQAIDKAIEEPEMPIVAFRVNAERYRKFLSEELSHTL